MVLWTDADKATNYLTTSLQSGCCHYAAKGMFKLVDKNFPPGHVLHSICNRSTIKVSYRSLPNFKTVIAKHNSKVLKTNAKPKPKASCNCRIKKDCPVPGQCNQDGAVYQATVTSATGRVETYIGLAKTLKEDGQNTKNVCWMKLQRVAHPYLNIIGRKKMQEVTPK